MEHSRIRSLPLLVGILAALAPVLAGQSILDLAGTWRFDVDGMDAGQTERWFLKPLSGAVRLPGSMTENGLGDEVSIETKWTGGIVDRSWFTAPEYAAYRRPGNVKVPFWLNPLKTYVGPAWYQRDVEIPAAWKGRRIVLELERCHWETRLWIDGREAGTRDALGVPHVYELTALLAPGRHTLTLRVDNRIKDVDVGENAHSVSDHTQTNWNGVVGRMTLTAGSLVHLEDLRIFPDPSTRTVRVEALVRNASGRRTTGTLVLQAASVAGAPFSSPRISVPFTAAGADTRLEVVYALGPGAPLWDEFAPNVLELAAELRTGPAGVLDARRVRFGLREFKVVGTRFAVNGRPIFLRGTLECAIFPLTGYPALAKAEWRRIYGVVKAHGLNHMRFHSWCPPEAAFDAADEAGVFLYVECGAWTTVGDGRPIDKWLYEESERLVRAYGNHPSFCLMSYGNEPGGKDSNAYLAKFAAYWRSRDPRRVYTTAAGWPLLPESDFHLSPEPRIQRWGEGLGSVINSRPPQTLFDFREFVGKWDKPVISHEIGQWCVYPDFREIPKYTGVLKAKNFEIFRETLAAAGLSALAPEFVQASGKLQALCYKADIEAALRTPGFAGFELLDLHDFPGQGTALVGVLDPFWDEKGYVSPAEFRRFSGPTVPLVRLPKMVYAADEKFVAEVEVAHFGPAAIAGTKPAWTLSDATDRPVLGGELAKTDIPLGNGFALGRIEVDLAALPVPARYRLTVRVGDALNDWNIWVYPAALSDSGETEIRVVRRLDPETASFLEKGGRVILTAAPGSVKPEKGGGAAVGFSSIFWNTAWTSKQPPHTLGILADPKHPALAAFPTETHSDWQWRDAMSHAQALSLSDLVPGLKPIVRIIDDWVTNRPLGLIFEVRVGQGALIVTGIDLLTDRDKRPEARQLFHSLMRYAASGSFRPAASASLPAIQGLFK